MFTEQTYFSFAKDIIGCMHVVFVLGILVSSAWRCFVLKLKIKEGEIRNSVKLIVLVPLVVFLLLASRGGFGVSLVRDVMLVFAYSIMFFLLLDDFEIICIAGDSINDLV
jgi:hypothetical protein